MVREITAFVLMNVSGKREDRIVEKLFELKEVREIYSVHGDVDVLVKIVLTRDLISSDAETIGQFVHNQVRKKGREGRDSGDRGIGSRSGTEGSRSAGPGLRYGIAIPGGGGD